MKEISQELLGRDAVICVACGAIFVNAPRNAVVDCIPCPECGKGMLYWITSAHTWHPAYRRHNDND